MTASENQIVVYQPNETVWLTQEQMALLFGRDQSVIARHIGNIFKEDDLDKSSVYAKNTYTASDGKELYLIGASLKDLGRKCFAFTKLDAGEIPRIKKSAFGVGERREVWYNMHYMKLCRYRESSKAVAICAIEQINAMFIPSLRRGFDMERIGTLAKLGSARKTSLKCRESGLCRNRGKREECNREVAPFKQRFLTRCNRMAVSDAVCVI